jgi:hypothetical protein
MAYDPELADRIRELIQAESGVSEKHMFGGLAFLVNGNLAVSASGKGGLLVRVPPFDAEALVRATGAETAVMGGRELTGWLRVDPSAVGTDAGLREWVARGVAYASSLRPK